jgi:hypothetical protein
MTIETEKYKQKELVRGKLGCLTAIVLASAVVYGVISGIKGCNDEARMKRERIIPSPVEVQQYFSLRERALEDIEMSKKHHWKTEYTEGLIKEYDNQIQKSREEIKDKIEKGYLTPENHYYEDYKKIFGNEEWWIREEKK